MPDTQAGLWENVRHALGRLIAAARVQELPLDRFSMRPEVLRPDALAVPAPSPGAMETHWRPGTRSLAVTPPWAIPGGNGLDLAPIAASVNLDAALCPEIAGMHAAAIALLAPTVRRLGVVEANDLAVRLSPVAVTGGEARSAAARPPAPNTARLPVTPPSLPRRSAAPRRGRGGEADPLPLSGGRVRAGAAAIAEVPMLRPRAPAPRDLAAVDAFADERRRLAKAAAVAEDDVLLLGVFPKVPVAAVRNLALEENGALLLWLKPEAVAAAAAGRVPPLATLIVGRRRSTGRMIQTVA